MPEPERSASLSDNAATERCAPFGGTEVAQDEALVEQVADVHPRS